MVKSGNLFRKECYSILQCIHLYAHSNGQGMYLWLTNTFYQFQSFQSERSWLWSTSTSRKDN